MIYSCRRTEATYAFTGVVCCEPTREQVYKTKSIKFTPDFVAIEQIHIQTSHSCWLLVKVTTKSKNICFHAAFFPLCHIGIPLKCSIARI